MITSLIAWLDGGMLLLAFIVLLADDEVERGWREQGAIVSVFSFITIVVAWPVIIGQYVRDRWRSSK